MKLGTDVLNVAPADGAEEDDEEDPVKVHTEDRADVIVAVRNNTPLSVNTLLDPAADSRRTLQRSSNCTRPGAQLLAAALHDLLLQKRATANVLLQ